MNPQDFADAIVMAAELNAELASALSSASEIVLRASEGAIEVVVGELSERIEIGAGEEPAPEGEVAS